MTYEQGFRPQQGLPIMNKEMTRAQKKGLKELGFRPQQGLPIMNSFETKQQLIQERFRPQQGLPIMNITKGLSKE